MEATFVMKPEELTTDWLEQLKSRFTGEESVTITAVSADKPLSEEQQRVINQRAMFTRLRESQKKYPSITIPAHVDINELIDEMYWEGNH